MVQRCIDQTSIVVLALLLVEVGVDGGLGLHRDWAVFDLSWPTDLTVDLVQDLRQVLMLLLLRKVAIIFLAHICNRLGGSASTSSLNVNYGVCNGSIVHKLCSCFFDNFSFFLEIYL